MFVIEYAQNFRFGIEFEFNKDEKTGWRTIKADVLTLEALKVDDVSFSEYRDTFKVTIVTDVTNCSKVVRQMKQVAKRQKCKLIFNNKQI